jgi:hypothetical protein
MSLGATGGEFYSPSRNISCEIDYDYGSTTERVPNEAFCETLNPPRSVVLTASGGLKLCTGEVCLGQAGVNTPTLAYGTATGAGPFGCLSQLTGMTCRLNGAQGFTIAISGVIPIGDANIIAQGTTPSVLQ